jgi:ATP-dependent phosphofructokinase / diphosphate-dependent phosphofructokinase
VLFDRFYAAQLGGHAVDMLLQGQVNSVAILQWDHHHGFHVADIPANALRDRWGHIHARQMHETFYDPKNLRPSRVGIDYLMPIFTNSIGADDVESMRSAFNPGNLETQYHSVNTDVNKRIRHLE